MSLRIEYPERCEIKRGNGIDVNGDEVFIVVYDGVCCLQYEGDGETHFNRYEFESRPKIFIPINDILFQLNDRVVVYGMNGRVSEYTIRQFESISDDYFPELNDTCIWLKGGTDE